MLAFVKFIKGHKINVEEFLGQLSLAHLSVMLEKERE